MKRKALYLLPKDLQIEIIENIERKNLTASEIVATQKRIQNELVKFTEQGKRTDLGKTSSKILEKVDHGTIELIAKIFGESHETTRKRYRIVEAAEADPETFGDVLESVDSGKTSLSHAYTKIKRREKHRKPKPLPEGEWAVILADPPWPYYLPLRGAPDAHYPGMTKEEILEMKFPSAEDAVLFLWATNPQLEFAIEVMNSKGFGYRTDMVWVKDIFGTGHYFRGQHELLLLGIKGGMPPPIEEVRFPSVLMSPRRKHSEKPEEVYEIIETMYPNQKYIELFARPTSRRKDWSYWGLEA